MARKLRRTAAAPRVEGLEARTLSSLDGWQGYADDPEHTALSPVASADLASIHWQAPVDLAPQYSDNELSIHYGSPLVTASNTVIVPVKTGASGGFELQARSGATGTLQWTLTSDYALMPASGTSGYDWTPSYSPTLTPANRLYFAGLGGTVEYTDTPDAAGPTPPTTGRLAFFGLSNYEANPSAYDGTVFIDTPITSDSAGDIFFGFLVTGSNPLGLTSGVARIGADGTGSSVAVVAGTTQVAANSAPALSNDGSTLYVLESNGNFGSGKLVALDSQTLAVKAQVTLMDPQNTSNPAEITNDATASPTVGPDGDVYVGVLENPFASNHDRGWLLHFSGDLGTAKIPGAFGWDDTASIVPASMVPSYHGSSTYLLMTKYNNYAGAGGDGVNKLAILDPNAMVDDPVTGACVMQEVMTIAGPTPDPEFISSHPNAVREWCINTAVVDPATDSILANSEDGTLYRWNLATNTFTQKVTLTAGVGEAYTPTLIGVDGTVYAINNATLFAIGSPQVAGTWFINGNQAVQIQQDNSRLTFTNEFGDSSPGSFLNSHQVVATGWGNLVGTLVPTADGMRILWANGTSWEQLQLAGQGVIGNRGVQIDQDGNSLTFLNEDGNTSPGYIADVNHVVATGWGNLVGTLSPTFEGFRINWANGTVWDMLRLAGTWFINGSQPSQVVQPGNGNTLTFINEFGGTSAGYFQDNSHVVATGWGNLVGTLVPTALGIQIDWSNGTSWDELRLGGQWFIGNDQATAIYQGPDGLALVNERGELSSGSVTSADQIVATDWGNLVGTVVTTSTGRQINWSNGSSWYSPAQ
jgi:hypothetical protein